jgi:leucine dehydrogenase
MVNFCNWKGPSKKEWIQFFGQLSFNDRNKCILQRQDTGLKQLLVFIIQLWGPLGGTRMFDYANEWEGVKRRFTLSLEMTYKSSNHRIKYWWR